MTTFWRWWLRLACWAGIQYRVLAVGGIVDDLSQSGLLSFPHGRDDDITELILQDNLISEVDYIEPYQYLKRLVLDLNYLTEFPNLINISQVLEELSLNQNNIHTVDATYLDELVQLRVLELHSNDLTSFPDALATGYNLQTLVLDSNLLETFPILEYIGETLLDLSIGYNQRIAKIPNSNLILLSNLRRLALSGMKLAGFPDLKIFGSTLEELVLNDNDISAIDEDRVAELGQLNSLYIENNNIQSVPNLCRRPHLSTLVIHASSNPILCDHTARWGKIAELAKTALLKLECLHPPNLKAVSWSDLNMGSLQGPIGTPRMSRFSPVDVSSYTVRPLYVKGVKSRSLLQCSTICFTEPSCVFFSFDRAKSLCKIPISFTAVSYGVDSPDIWYAMF